MNTGTWLCKKSDAINDVDYLSALKFSPLTVGLERK